jgi:membrane protein DedA with SNARE-associated domain
MTAALTQELAHLVAIYGLPAVLLLMAAESCGLPIPSEVVMPAAGLLAATGHLPLAAAIVAGALGNLLGSLVAYWLAARFGEPLLLGPGSRVGFSKRHLQLATRWFHRHQMAAIFFGRLLPVVRTYISFPAGLARVPVVSFAALTLAGSLPWSAALALVGYVLGRNYSRISGPMEVVSIALAVVVVVALVTWFRHGRRAERGSLVRES